MRKLIAIALLLSFSVPAHADTYTDNYNFRMISLDVEDEDTPWGEKYNDFVEDVDDALYGIAISTGLVALEAIKVSTGALALSTATLTDAVTALEVSTGAIQVEVDALEISTGAIQVEVDALEVSTGTLQANIDALETSTGTFVLRAGDTMTGILNLDSYAVKTTSAITAGIYQIDGSSFIATRGSYGTMVGVGAGAGVTGDYNTCLGSNAGYGITTGSRNTLVGASAGHNTTGSWNTFIGLEAGAATTSGEYNILIGETAAAPTGATSYYLNIGDLITGVLNSSSATVHGSLYADDFYGDGSTLSNLIYSTATISASITALEVSTGALAASTATLTTDIAALEVSTGALAASTATLTTAAASHVLRAGDVMTGSLTVSSFTVRNGDILLPTDTDAIRTTTGKWALGENGDILFIGSQYGLGVIIGGGGGTNAIITDSVGQVTMGYGVVSSSHTQIGYKTEAQLFASTPTAYGQMFYCTDCTVTPVVISTGISNSYDWTGIGSFALPD